LSRLSNGPDSAGRRPRSGRRLEEP
jgi:hypothetical protein